ncbi:hypothetical protein [Methanimicrococcus hongohii]|uniref:hypothetical protein n=1 Tax=Methanimicrococcus hongohii TaxID=3028295 RepID=UPI00292D6ED0|nr:hypothetical protein [Methanimicrococcus sp. Hf6]
MRTDYDKKADTRGNTNLIGSSKANLIGSGKANLIGSGNIKDSCRRAGSDGSRQQRTVADWQA